jgi:hypothetical protein
MVLRIVLAFAMTTAIAASSAGSNQSSQSTAAISGLVIDAQTARPVAGVIVSLGRADTPDQFHFRTDEAGRFVFAGVAPAADYVLASRKLGYAFSRFGAARPGGSPASADSTRVQLVAGEWRTGITIRLWPAASISGTILDESNQPMAGVTVRLYARRTLSGRDKYIGGPSTVTNDLGEYSFGGLEAGRYLAAMLSTQMTVAETGREPWRKVLTPVSRGDGAAYPPSFYPGTPAIAAAGEIRLNQGEQRKNVSIGIRPVRAVTVSGKIEGMPPVRGSAVLRLIPADCETLGVGIEAATTTVAADNSFRFRDVPTGEYTLILQDGDLTELAFGDRPGFLPAPAGFQVRSTAAGSAEATQDLSYSTRETGQNNVWARMSLAVGDKDISDLQLPARLTGGAAGRIVLADGSSAGLKDSVFTVSAVPADGDPTWGRHVARTTRADALLNFSLSGLWATRYGLEGFNGLGVVSMTAGGVDITSSGLDMATAGTADIVVTLTDNFAEVSGRLAIDRPSDAVMVLVPADRKLWTGYGWKPRSLRTARAGQAGAFRFDRVPKGDYFVIAIREDLVPDLLAPAFLTRAVANANPVSVAWGQRASGVEVRKVVETR